MDKLQNKTKSLKSRWTAPRNHRKLAGNPTRHKNGCHKTELDSCVSTQQLAVTMIQTKLSQMMQNVSRKDGASVASTAKTTKISKHKNVRPCSGCFQRCFWSYRGHCTVYIASCVLRLRKSFGSSARTGFPILSLSLSIFAS